MKHPFWDRILMLITAAVCIAAAAGIVMLILGKFSLGQVTDLLGRIDFSRNIVKAMAGAAAAVCALFGVFMLSMMTPARKKKSSNFAIQRNENGMVRISLKALETLVNKVLNQHAELKVVTSSLFSDEETIRVDVHIALQSDISMPLAISSLQKQIKRYIEACSGVQVSEVRIFVDSTLPSDENAAKSPYAIPESLLKGTDALSEGHPEEEPASPPKSEPVPEVKPEPDPEPASAPGKAEFGQSDFMREAYAPKSEPAPTEETDEAEEEAEPAESAETEAEAEAEAGAEAGEETGEAPAEGAWEEPEVEPEEEPEPAEEPEEEDEFATGPEDGEEPEFEEDTEPAEESFDTEEPEELPEEEYPEEEPAAEEQPEEELSEEELPEEGSAFGGNHGKNRKTGESAFGADAEGTGDAL